MNYFDLLDKVFEAEKNVEIMFLDIVDKAGRPYFDHCLFVAEESYNVAKKVNLDMNSSLKVYIVGILHDVVEDIPYVSIEDIKEKYGDEIADAVDALTRRDDELDIDYYERIFKNKYAMIVKYADTKHNKDISRFKNPSERDIKKSEKYSKLNKNLADKLGI